MSHNSGVSGWDEPFHLTDIYDLKASTARLASQAPWFPPAKNSGYHAVKYGHVVNEIVHQVSGKSLQEFIADDIAHPVSADFSLGAPQSEWNRVAEIIPLPAPVDVEAMMANLDPQSLRMRTLGSLRVEFANSP